MIWRPEQKPFGLPPPTPYPGFRSSPGSSGLGAKRPRMAQIDGISRNRKEERRIHVRIAGGRLAEPTDVPELLAVIPPELEPSFWRVSDWRFSPGKGRRWVSTEARLAKCHSGSMWHEKTEETWEMDSNKVRRWWKLLKQWILPPSPPPILPPILPPIHFLSHPSYRISFLTSNSDPSNIVYVCYVITREI